PVALAQYFCTTLPDTAREKISTRLPSHETAPTSLVRTPPRSNHADQLPALQYLWNNALLAEPRAKTCKLDPITQLSGLPVIDPPMETHGCQPVLAVHSR